MNEGPQAIVDSFIQGLTRGKCPRRSLLLRGSTFEVFRLPDATTTVREVHRVGTTAVDDRYDFILADLPLGLPKVPITIGSHFLRVRENWAGLTSMLQLLAHDGLCVALLEPAGLATAEGPRLQAALAETGFSVSGYFNTPEGSLLPHSSVRPIIGIFGQGPQGEVFAAELQNTDQAAVVARRFLEAKGGRTLSEGLHVSAGAFSGFGRLRADQQLAGLETQYSEYEAVPLAKIAVQINAVASGAEHIQAPNAIYIPALGTSPVVTDLSTVTLRHHNVFQVVLSAEVIAEYVAAFFTSEPGRLVLEGLRTGSVIAKIRKKDLVEAQVALPPPAEQKEIAVTHGRLAVLLDAIAGLRQELAVNPRSAAAIKDQLEDMLARIGRLSDADRIMSLARNGESRTVEFKQTLSTDLKTGKKEKYIELSALKTVAAFLNTVGGWLVVGVSDHGELVGVDDEITRFPKGHDGFLLHAKNLIESRVGAEFYPFIEHRLVSANGRRFLLVECKSSPNPCYLDGRDFYVRTNPATDKLEGPKLVEYIRNHFSQ